MVIAQKRVEPAHPLRKALVAGPRSQAVGSFHFILP